MDIGEGLKALADALPYVAFFLGAGYAIGYVYREHWRQNYKTVRERTKIALGLLNVAKYDLKSPKDIYVFSKTVDALLSDNETDRGLALADINRCNETEKRK